MKVRIALLLTALLLIADNAYAGLFGPSNYDECALEVSKNAKTDAAVGVGIRACKSKFKSAPTVSRNGSVCKTYWDGFKIRAGERKGKGGSIVSIERKGTPIEIGMSDSALEYFGLNGKGKGNVEFFKMLDENLYIIESICSPN